MKRLLPLLFLVLLGQTGLTQTISGNSGYCPGGSTVLTITAPANSTYQWQRSTDSGTTWANVGTNALTYTASSLGIYRAIITTSGNADTSNVIAVTQSPVPTASFTFTPNYSCAKTAVQFTNTSQGATSYVWNFNDPNSPSTTSTETNPTHFFWGTPGNTNQTFSVALIATNSFGCTATYSSNVTAKRRPDPNLNGTNRTTYDGAVYFRQCTGAGSGTLSFSNSSSTTSINTDYTIVWGDNTPDYQKNNFNQSLTHTYSTGTYPLSFIVKGDNGCVDTGRYFVYIGSVPAVGLSKPADTYICTGSTLTFPITGTEANPPGTVYTLSFNDGSTPIKYTHPAPASETHTFDSTSCNTTSYTYTSAFAAVIKAENPCQSASAFVVPIYVNQKPKAIISINTKDTICKDQITVTLTSNSKSNGIDNGSCVSGKLLWSITPATGWTKTGNLGTDNGDADPNMWTSGDRSLNVRFTATGTYTVKLKVGNASNCGLDSVTKTIYVNAPPTGSFSLDQVAGCAPLTVTATSSTNTQTYGQNSVQWLISYSPISGCAPSTSSYRYLQGTNVNSAAPVIQFVNPGIYTVSLLIYGPGNNCTNVLASQTVYVKGKVNHLINAPTSACEGDFVSISAYASCYITNASTYLWSFPGGTPSSATTFNPGSIRFNGVTSTKVSLTATNECGDSTVTRTILINPLPDLSVPSNLDTCAGSTVGPFTSSSQTTGVTYAWGNPNTSIGLAGFGTTNPIPSFILKNTTTAPISSTINVTATKNGCTTLKSFTITAKPQPAAPAVNAENYCVGDTPHALSAVFTPGNAPNWYTTSTGGTPASIAPLPSTVTAGTTFYYVSQTNASGCESQRTPLTVVVQPIPTITASTANNPTACATATGSILLSGLAVGISYTVNYQKNGSPVTTRLTANSSGVITISGLAAGTYSNVTLTGTGCPSKPAGPFVLSDPTPPATPSATGSSSICAGGTITLNATGAPTGGTYQWTGPNGFTSTSANPTILNATISATGTYYVVTKLNGCTSTPAPVSVQVNAAPGTPAITTNSPLCSGSTLTLSTGSTGNGTTTYSWSGPNGFSATGLSVSIPDAQTAHGGTYSVVASTGSGGCSSPPATTFVVITPVPVITATATSPASCTAQNGTIRITGLTANTVYTIQYTRDAAAPSVLSPSPTSNSSGEIIITGLGAGVYSAITATQGSCSSNAAGPLTLTAPNPPASPTLQSNGPVCSGATLSITATGPAGASYVWKGPNGYSSTDQNLTISNATSAASGTYTVKALLNGCSSDPATIDAVVNPTPLAPAISSNSPVCEGGTLALTSTGGAGGNVTYLWTGPGNYTSTEQNPTISSVQPLASGTYTLQVSEGSCSAPPVTTIVSVSQPPVISATLTNPSSCLSTNGSILVSGLKPNVAYQITYSRNGAAPTTLSLTADGSGGVTLSKLPAGIYSGITASVSGCTSNELGPLTLEESNAPPAPTVSSTSPLCAGATLNLFANTAVTSGVTFLWTGPNGFRSTQQNPTITSAAPSMSGTYTVQTTINGCTSSPATLNVVVNSLPNVVAGPDLNLCRGQSIQFNARGALTYQWYPITGLSCNNCSNPIATPASSVTYIIEGKDNIGCSSLDTVKVNVVQPFTLTASRPDSICLGVSVNLIATGAPLYRWTPAQSLDNPNVFNPVATPSGTTLYTVTGYDPYNCFTQTADVLITVGQKPTIDLGRDQVVQAGSQLPLNSSVTNGPIRKWTWTPATDLSCSSCALPVATIKKDIAYTAVVTNSYGCTATDTIYFKVTCSPSQIYIPNAFSPDGDGINDVLMIRGSGIRTVKYFRVFNRWGELVFEKNNFLPNDPLYSWDGKVKGVKGPPDVFVYTVEAVCETGASFSYKGNVTLIR